MYAGKRMDSYGFFGAIGEDGRVWVLAGCRIFTLEEAREHWRGTITESIMQQSLGFVDAIRQWATVGQPLPAEPAAEPATADTADCPPEGARADLAAVREHTPERVPMEVVVGFLGPVLGEMFRNWLDYRHPTDRQR